MLIKREVENLKENVKETDRSNRENIDSMIKLIQDNDDFMRKVMNVNKKMTSLEKQFNQIQEFNLECLVTKRYFNCLSCGSKKINYLPLHKYALGDDSRAYRVDPASRRPDAFVNMSNVFASRSGQKQAAVTNLQFGGARGRSADKPKGDGPLKKMEYKYRESPFKLGKHVCGKDVFDRDMGQLQHHERRHCNDENVERNKKFAIKRKRPMSSLRK